MAQQEEDKKISEDDSKIVKVKTRRTLQIQIIDLFVAPEAETKNKSVGKEKPISDRVLNIMIPIEKVDDKQFNPFADNY